MAMLDMLIKQFAPEINMGEVQTQIKAFAEMFAKMAKSVEHTEALAEALHDQNVTLAAEVASLRAELMTVKNPTQSVGEILQTLQIGNDHDDSDRTDGPTSA